MATTHPHTAAQLSIHSSPGDAAARLSRYGTHVLRYGTFALLFMFGALKFTEAEALGIQPLVGNHPLMSWMYDVFGLRGTSDIIGVVELIAAVLMLTRRWRPAWSAIGSAIATLTFAVTLSFLFTTPGAFAPDSPIGGFLMKDLILFGAALYTTGEALAASRDVP